MDCLSNKPQVRGQLLDAMRYFFTQQAIFVSKLKFCPKIDYSTIKDITSNTGEEGGDDWTTGEG